MGAVGSAAPWFLTGWADEVEIEFMIDTGCQVTILAASVFEHMCTSDPQMRAWLCPCGRRLVSAGSDGLLGTEALQSCLPHQLDLRTGEIVGGRTIDATAAPTE